MPKIPLKKTDQSGQTKIQQLVFSITEAIGNGTLKDGDSLPSVNQLSHESGFSRDTVFKAYRILKKRDIIESAPTRGYFVKGSFFRIFVLLDDFSAFKEQLYKSFRENLPQNFTVDLLFHHYNPDVFNQLVQNSLGRYSAYVVMNINHGGTEPVLEKIDPKKLFILDMGHPASDEVSYVIQDFDFAVEKCLEEGVEKLQKYEEFILVYDELETPHPSDTVAAVKRFCKKTKLHFRNVTNVSGALLQKGQVWFTIRDSDLVEVIKLSRDRGFILGKDVGVLSYNDTPMKQIVGNGISVITTDFSEMGSLAASFAKNRQKIAKVLPTSLILRESV
ncbi:transcriptional regulator, GntR family [Mariniphaga anaerophila]|uniref:Transcriptional regulator, GntR family n=1 Tax=Mariniphaga anaerophila TaxID=1484053 RepID=A0A1M4VW71_9BACT|nr:winged helix-turn-helix domain-containing protein [Mariniphaga anaerophila]SHE73216.1 transcriptional regulator, GntR family [Mariniphaga anaerophila]